MTMANLFPGSRARCSAHGLMLDDASKCARCVRESDREAGRSLLGRMVKIALAMIAALVMYRVGDATYDMLKSGSHVGGSSPAVAVAGARNGSRLVVYTSSGCGACRLAKAWMKDHSVAYEERSVDSDVTARHELASLPKGKGVVVPTFVVDDDEVLVGFDVRGVRLSQSLDKHGIERSR